MPQAEGLHRTLSQEQNNETIRALRGSQGRHCPGCSRGRPSSPPAGPAVKGKGAPSTACAPPSGTGCTPAVGLHGKMGRVQDAALRTIALQ